MYGVEILLERSLTPYILSLYLPSTILVIISWLSYLLSHPLLRLAVELVVTSLRAMDWSSMSINFFLQQDLS